MAVAGEVEKRVGAHIGELLVTPGVDVGSEVFERPFGVGYVDAPEVLATVSARHVGGEDEPFAVGRYCRMSNGRERVGGDFILHRLAPRLLGALRSVYFHSGVGHRGAARHGEVHGGGVGREAAYSLLHLGVQFALGRFGALPFAALVLLGVEDVGFLGAGDFALGGAGGLFGGGGEVEHVGVLVEEHRGIVGAARVEEFGVLHHVARVVAVGGLHGIAATLHTLLGELVLRLPFQIGVVSLHGVAVLAFGLEGAPQQEVCRGVRVMVAYGVLVGGRGAGKLAKARVALPHLEGHFAAQFAVFLLGQGVVDLSVSLRGVEVFAAGKLLVGLRELRSLAGRQQQQDHERKDIC